MAVRTRRRSTFKQVTVGNAPPTPANAAAVWWADDIAQADGSQVASWTDRVNNISVTQATSGARPVFDTDGLNGKPSVNFDGVDDWLGLSSVLSSSNAGTVITVTLLNDPLQGQSLWSHSQAGGSRYLIGTTRYSTGGEVESQQRNNDFNDVVNGSTSVPAVTSVVIEWTSNSVVYAHRLNNNVQTLIASYGSNTGDWFGDVTSPNRWTIGALRHTSTTGYLGGRIAYIGVFDSPLSAQDRYDLYKWIQDYYGITGMPGLSDYEQAVLADAPSAFWPMQETSGNITDITGNGFIGTKVGSGGVTYDVGGPVAGVGAIEFAGSSGVGYSVADNNLWSSTNFTIEGWIYLASGFFGAQPARYFLTKHVSSVTNEWFTAIENVSGRRLIAQVCNAGDTNWANKIEGPTWGAENTWYHVAWKLSGSTVTLYVNGVAVGYAASGSGTRAGNASGVLSIGHGPAVADRSWNGRMAMVAFYPQALSDSQILAHYQAMT